MLRSLLTMLKSSFSVSKILISLIFIYIVPASANELIINYDHELDPKLQSKIPKQLRLYKDINMGKQDLKQSFAYSLTELQNVIKNIGFWGSIVTSTYKKTDDGYKFIYNVKLNTPIKINSVKYKTSVYIDNLFADSLVDSYSQNIGKPFNQDQYEDLKSDIITSWNKEGYLHAKFSQKIVYIDEINKTADITLELDPGQTSYIGSYIFDSNKYDYNFLRGLISVPEGDIYAKKNIDIIKKELLATNLFNEVYIRSNNLAAPGALPINIMLDEQKTHQFKYSIGYGSEERLRTGLKYTKRLVEFPGNKIQFETNYNKKSYNGSLQLQVPGNKYYHDFLKYELNFFKDSIKSFSVKHLNIVFKKKYNFDNYISSEIAFKYLYEMFERNGSETKVGYLFPSINLRYNNIYQSHGVLPRGLILNFDSLFSVDNIFSETTFIKNIASFKYINHIGKVAYSISGEAGIIGGGNFDDIPISERFWLGGYNSVRGFSYKSIGPEDGGRIFYRYAFDLERLVSDETSIGLFYDLGNSYRNKWLSPKEGVGIGLRWYTMGGKLNFDLATPIEGLGNHRSRVKLLVGYNLYY